MSFRDTSDASGCGSSRSRASTGVAQSQISAHPHGEPLKRIPGRSSRCRRGYPNVARSRTASQTPTCLRKRSPNLRGPSSRGVLLIRQTVPSHLRILSLVKHFWIHLARASSHWLELQAAMVAAWYPPSHPSIHPSNAVILAGPGTFCAREVRRTP